MLGNLDLEELSASLEIYNETRRIGNEKDKKMALKARDAHHQPTQLSEVQLSWLLISPVGVELVAKFEA